MRRVIPIHFAKFLLRYAVWLEDGDRTEIMRRSSRLMKFQRVMALYLNKSFNRIKLDLIQNLIL